MDELSEPRGSALGPVYPFRWDVTKRSQLGRLIGNPGSDRDRWLQWEAITAKAYRWADYPYAWFLNELTLCAARVLSLCDDSDLCFVGRSPESLFDYLSGLLFDTSWASRLTLLHFSMYRTSHEEVEKEYPGALEEMRKYLTLLGLDPETLAQRERPVAFVDIVDQGGTLGNLMSVLQTWCKQSSFDWSAVQRKIRIVGLTERQESSPKTWRWQQHAEWIGTLGSSRIKNVSIPMPLFQFLGGAQPKTTLSYTPERWGDLAVASPVRNPEHILALRVAAALFDDGRDKVQRVAFSAKLSKQPAMQFAWFRSLLSEVKSSPVTA